MPAGVSHGRAPWQRLDSVEAVLDRLIRAVFAVARIGAWVCGGLFILAAAAIGVEVVMRKAFRVSVVGLDELSGYVLAIGTAWALSYALVLKAHIRIDTLYGLLSARFAVLLDFLSITVFGAFITVVSWHGWGVVEQSYMSNTRGMSTLEVPVVVPQALWLAGLAFFVAAALLLLLRSLLALSHGDLITVQSLIGSRSAMEELEAALRERDDAEREAAQWS